MKKLLRVYLILLFLALVLFISAGCGTASDAPDPTQSEAVVESEESAYILGRWGVNDGRFGHKIFDFQADGRLLLEDVDSGETIEMRYQFVSETSLVLSGYEDFNGSSTVAFFDDKMDLTITFEGEIFAELYEFTRIPDASS